MGDGKHRPGPNAADLESLAKRFQDLWQEQMAATASDPEFLEMMSKWMGTFAAAGLSPPASPGVGAAGPLDPAAWTAAMQQALAAAGTVPKGRSDDRSANAGSRKTGTAATTPALGAGDVDRDRLERRLADLEKRVERLEAGTGQSRKGDSTGTRRRKS